MDDDVKLKDLYTKIRELRNELKLHASEAKGPKCAALCETSSEVVGGLETAFDHYINKTEKSWE